MADKMATVEGLRTVYCMLWSILEVPEADRTCPGRSENRPAKPEHRLHLEVVASSRWDDEALALLSDNHEGRCGRVPVGRHGQLTDEKEERVGRLAALHVKEAPGEKARVAPAKQSVMAVDDPHKR